MERRKIAINGTAGLLAVAVTVLIVANSNVLSPSEVGVQGNSTEISFFSSTGDKKASITAEVADTPEERRNGLMNRTSLDKDHGMLFIFPDEKKRAFWMKNTYIPLDIIYIAENKTIVDIDQADPEPNASIEDFTAYPSEKPAKYVIEVNQGFSENNSIEKGGRISIR